MSTTPAAVPAKAKLKLGLRAWMEAVLVECERTAAGFDADSVHDLRVAIRRCRFLADGLMAMDPDPSWKQMRKAGKKLFRALGDLRDMHVLQQWVEKLSDADDPVAVKLLAHARTREAQSKEEALSDLQQFDRKQWRQWSRTLPRRAARVRPGSIVFKHLALERWTAAYDLHKRAMHTRSQTALHELRDRTLPRRAARVRPGSIVFKHLALERWTAAYDLHKRAMHTRSQTALHEL